MTGEREELLRGKRVLIVDDEPDILGSLEDLLDMCELDKASDYEGAKKFLESKEYDAAILDIMGVRGYDLLEETAKRGIPTLMLTAHALSADNFVKSIRSGAHAYVPKDKISEIGTFLLDVLEEAAGKAEKRKRWFERLEDFFEQKFGDYWKDKEDPEFWKKYFYM